MRRAGWLALILLFVGCSNGTDTADSGVATDASIPDSGPATIPARQDDTWRALPTLDRVGRPFVAELLVSTATAAPAPREAYNDLEPQAHFPGGQLHLVQVGSGAPTAAALMIDAIALFDGLDGQCGVGTLTSSTSSVAAVRYRDLGGMLADDCIWLSTTSTCTAFPGIEGTAYDLGPVEPGCGGRRPGDDSMDAMLQLLADLPLTDGATTSTTAYPERFPYLAEP